MRKIIASVDLGSDSIKFLVAEITKNKVDVLASKEIHSKGIKAGVIVNESEVCECLKEGFKALEESLDVKISKILVGIPSVNIDFIISEGLTTITNDDHVITGDDIARALQSSVNNIPGNMELINIIPLNWTLDDDKVVDDPKKMIANKLSVQTIITMGSKKEIYDIIRCFEKIGIEVIDISLSSIGDYYAHKNDNLDEEIGALINLGEDITTVSIFNKKVITNTISFDLGGGNIDNDISFIYKLTRKDARYLKENLALAHRRLADASETLEIVNKLEETIKINQYEITEIVVSRLTEILNLAKKQINLLTKKEISYIIFTGGLTEIKDFSLLLEETFNKKAILGNLNIIGIRNNKYSSVLGLIKYFDEKLKLRNKSYSILNTTEQEELSRVDKKLNISNDGIFGKIVGYFFDN